MRCIAYINYKNNETFKAVGHLVFIDEKGPKPVLPQNYIMTKYGYKDKKNSNREYYSNVINYITPIDPEYEFENMVVSDYTVKETLEFALHVDTLKEFITWFDELLAGYTVEDVMVYNAGDEVLPYKGVTEVMDRQHPIMFELDAMLHLTALQGKIKAVGKVSDGNYWKAPKRPAAASYNTYFHMSREPLVKDGVATLYMLNYDDERFVPVGDFSALLTVFKSNADFSHLELVLNKFKDFSHANSPVAIHMNNMYNKTVYRLLSIFGDQILCARGDDKRRTVELGSMYSNVAKDYVKITLAEIAYPAGIIMDRINFLHLLEKYLVKAISGDKIEDINLLDITKGFIEDNSKGKKTVKKIKDYEYVFFDIGEASIPTGPCVNMPKGQYLRNTISSDIGIKLITVKDTSGHISMVYTHSDGEYSITSSANMPIVLKSYSKRKANTVYK